MKQKNVHGQERLLIPQGYSKNGNPILRGAAISDENHKYLGFWDVRDMSKAVRRELQKELEANWYPHYHRPEDF